MGATGEVVLRLINAPRLSRVKDISSAVASLRGGCSCQAPFAPRQKAGLNPPRRSPGRSKSPVFHQLRLWVPRLCKHSQPRFSWVSLKLPNPAQFCDVFKCFIIFSCQLGTALGFVFIQKEGACCKAFLFPGKGLCRRINRGDFSRSDSPSQVSWLLLCEEFDCFS